jgi:hypothetical protein
MLGRWRSTAVALGAAIGMTAALAVGGVASASAAENDPSLISSLTRPVVLDGKRYTPKQFQKFDGQRLLFVLGSREEDAGAVAAFRTKAELKRYLRATDRVPRDSKKKARASYNGWETVFYADWFLEGPAISVTGNSSNGYLAQSCMYWTLWWCNTTWDNQISSAKTGYSGAYLYNRPWHDTTDGYVYLPAMDSVEVWRFFDNVTSSIWVP